MKDRAVSWYTKDFVDEVAALADTSEWRDVAPAEIPIDDLDADRMDDWGVDGWIRAVRSCYLDWLEKYRDSGEARPHGPACPAAYNRVRREFMASMAADGADDEEVENLHSSPDFAGRGTSRRLVEGFLASP